MKKKTIYILILLMLGTGVSYGAKAKAKKVNAEELLQNAREAFFNYNFDEASNLYEEYKELKNKAKEPIEDELVIWEKELEIAASAFERVQKIVVVDSISVPSDRFYEAYNIARSAGRISPYSQFNPENGRNKELAYINETGDYVIFPQKNSEGELRLYEKSLLLDGTWEEKETLEGDFEKTGDYAFPFMSIDGQTLYFANNGEDSMGGYDLFVAQRDPITGEYRQPLNLGMPFNSPYDDIMFALDEENGLGWWATDRNSFEGKVTVYVYLYEDIRKNYPADTENLADYAQMISYKETWVDDQNQPFTPVIPSINKTLHASVEDKRDFELSLGNGNVYYRYTDFKNRKASDTMKQYLIKRDELEKKETSLLRLRQQYKADKSIGEKIRQKETEIEDLRLQTRALKNDVLRLEKSVK